MPYISSKQLKRALEGEIKPEEKSITCINPSNSGPGNMEFQRILRGKDQPFLQAESVYKKQRKKTIIYSNTFLGLYYSAIEQQLLALIDAIFRCSDSYELKLWNDEKKISTIPSLINTADFWKNKETVVTASKEKILDLLAQQGLSSEDFIVVDSTILSRILMITKFSPETESWIGPNTNSTNEQRKKLKDGSFKQFSIISSLSSEELDDVLKLFPALEEISVSNVDMAWVKTNLKRFNGLTVNLQSFKDPDFVYPDECELVGLNILDSPLIKTIQINDKKNRLKKISLHQLGITTLNLIQCSELEKIGIRELNSLEFIALSADLPLKKLWIGNCGNLKKITPSLTVFKTLKLFESTAFLEIAVNDNPHLEILQTRFAANVLVSSPITLKKLSICNVIDLTPFSNLEELNLATWEAKNLVLPNPTLTTLRLYLCELLEKIILGTSVSKIEMLHITNCLNISYIDPAILSNLESLIIEEKLTNPTQLNLKGLNPKLKCLHLEGNIPIDLAVFTELEELGLSQYTLSELPFLPSLKRLTLNECHIEKLDFSKFPKLEGICMKNNVGLFSTYAPNLKTFYMDSVTVSELDCSGWPELECLEIYPKNGNPIKLVNLPKKLCKLINAAQEHSQTPNRRGRTNLNEGIELDNETGKPKNYLAEGNYEFELYDINGCLLPDEFRLRILNEIVFKRDKIGLTVPLDDKVNRISLPRQDKTLDTIAPIMKKEVEENKLYEMGMVSGKNVRPGVLIPLVSSTPIEKDSLQVSDFYYTPADAKIELYWNEIYQQYFFQLAHGEKRQNIDVLYRLKKNPTYIIKQKADNVLREQKRELLPMDLKKTLINKLATHKELHYLIDDNIPIAEKLEKLLDYFQVEFKTEKLPHNLHSETLWKIITNRVGVCRHKSIAFVILARLIGIPARLVYNSVHAYVELPYQIAPGKFEWIQHDLGGADRLDLTHDLVSRLDKIRTPKTESRANALLPEVKQYKALFAAAEEQKIMHSLSELLKIKNPLIELNIEQTPIATAAYLFKKLQEEKKYHPEKIIYIHEPSDFKLYLDPPIIDGTHTIKRQSGPLYTLIREGGVIIINWDNFPPEQILIYKSMLDDKPILGKNPMTSSDCKVIGLTKKRQEDQAFLSRCTAVGLSFKALAETKPEERKTELVTIEIDLFELHSWRSDLLGTVIFTKDGMRLEKAALIEAMNHADKFIIKNPPNDPEFNDLIEQLKQGLPLFYNGTWLTPKSGFEIIIQKTTSSLITELKNVSLETTETQDAKLLTRKKIFLGLHNYFDCFSQTIIEEGKPLQYQSGGLLANFNEDDKDIFYITESIPKNYWAKLLAHIKENYPNKHFTFMLSPGAEIADVKKNNIMPTKTTWTETVKRPTHSRIITSNDPDLCCKQLLKEFKEPPLIVNVTPQTTFADLIANIKVSALGLGQFKEQGVLSALLANRNVILNGELSPFLYQNLLSLLSSDPHLILNGKRISAPGQLFLITTKTPQLAETIERNYEFEDYRKLFPESDSYNLQKIQEFYTFVRKWPHQGVDRPKEPFVSYKRIQDMLNALKEKYPLHHNNPIKGLFIYDYPRYSEDYAYLNVLGKLYFSVEVEKPRNDKKLKKWWNLCTTPQKINEHVWQLLNCFSGLEVKSILGRPPRITMENGYPKLNPIALSELIALIREPKVVRKRPRSIIEDPYRPFTQREIKFLQKETSLLSAPRLYRPFTRKEINSVLNESPIKLKDAPPTIDLKLNKMSSRPKRTKNFEKLLANPTKPIIFLKGPAGTGKTYLVERQENVFDGETQIKDWIEDKSEGPKILLINEGNMLLPGALDFLKGLTFGQNEIYYDGKTYPVMPGKHKVVLTGNPENYPNRYYHRFIQEYAETFYLAKPSREELWIQIYPILKSLKPYIEKLIDAGELIEKYHSYFSFTRRDATNLAFRFNMLVQTQQLKDSKAIDQAVFQACIGEFSGSIKDITIRKNFEAALAKQLGIPPTILETKTSLVQLTPTFSLPVEKAPMLTALMQDLTMREYALAEMKSERPYKKIVLLEGSPGVGKTSLFLELMKKQGLKQSVATDTTKEYVYIDPKIKDREEEKQRAIEAKARGAIVIYADSTREYVHIVAGSPDAKIAITQAIQRGAIILLDELNADKSLEKFLIDNEKTLNASNALIFASQNASTDAGRTSVSEALRSRAHCIYFDPFENRELCALAGKIHRPDIFVEQFMQSRLTMRTFFHKLHELEESNKLIHENNRVC